MSKNHTHLILHDNGNWYYQRRVPEIARAYDNRRFVRCSLKTKSLSIALAKRDQLNSELEEIWTNAEQITEKTKDSYHKAITRCQALGFPYKPNETLIDGDLKDLVKRIEKIEQNYKAEPIARAALGTVKRPALKLSKAYDAYLRMAKGKLLGKSADQIRKWKNPRKKAIRNFIDVMGDLPIESIDVSTALTFREWWLDRMEMEGITANSVNKDMIHLWQIIKLAAQAERIQISNPFQGLNLTEENNSRKPLSTKNILEIIHHDDLMQMPDGARELIAVMAEQGMRVSEVAGLDDEEIVMESNIPYVHIKPNHHRAIKNKPSVRQLPLVGFALEIARQTGLTNLAIYRTNVDAASTSINNFLRAKNLLPSPDHSLYSLRHSFKDRLVAVDTPDRVVKDLMGHSSGNIKYGDGTRLEHKLTWLEKIALKVN